MKREQLCEERELVEGAGTQQWVPLQQLDAYEGRQDLGQAQRAVGVAVRGRRAVPPLEEREQHLVQRPELLLHVTQDEVDGAWVQQLA